MPLLSQVRRPPYPLRDPQPLRLGGKTISTCIVPITDAGTGKLDSSQADRRRPAPLACDGIISSV